MGLHIKSYKSYYHLHVKREDEKIHPTAKEAWPSLKKVQVSWEFKKYCPIISTFTCPFQTLFIFFLSRIGLYFLRWFKKRKKNQGFICVPSSEPKSPYKSPLSAFLWYVERLIYRVAIRHTCFNYESSFSNRDISCHKYVGAQLAICKRGGGRWRPLRRGSEMF